MKIKLFFLFLNLLFVVSCGREKPILEIGTFVEFSIPAGLSTIESHFFVQDNTPILYQSQLATTGIDPDNVDMFVSGTASLIPGAGRNFDLGFIRSVNVFLVEENGRRNELFFLDFVPIGEKDEIELLGSIVDLKDKITDDRASIETRLEFNTPPPTTFDMRLNMTFVVFGAE
jgi:hypothetical protein